MARRSGWRRRAHRRWRLLVGFWRRWSVWEFWPRWLFYPPIVIWILWLGLRHGGLSVFTAVNTRIWSGGIIGRSKARILDALSGTPEFVVRGQLLAAGPEPRARQEHVLEFKVREGLDWPIVLKPDMGARGAGVAIVRSDVEVLHYFEANLGAVLVQEFAPGREFGVFYLRFPAQPRGRVFSITDKQLATVIGDGRSCLEELILAHPRAVALNRNYCETNRVSLEFVPAMGEVVRLGEIGTHCRGAIFLDGNALKSEELEAVMDRISMAPEGFFFGRYDLRTESVEEFRRGRGFKIVELNGLVSEAAHLYDPQNSLVEAYRVLFEQWRLAAQIGRENIRCGAQTTSLGALLRLLQEIRRETQGAVPASME